MGSKQSLLATKVTFRFLRNLSVFQSTDSEPDSDLWLPAGISACKKQLFFRDIFYSNAVESRKISATYCVTIHHASLEVTFPSMIVWFKALVTLLLGDLTSVVLNSAPTFYQFTPFGDGQ